MAFFVAQTVENLPEMQETRVQSQGWEVLLEKGMAIHSSILASRIPWTEKPGGLQSVGLQRVGHNWATNTHTLLCPTPYPDSHPDYRLTGLTPAVTVDHEATLRMKVLCQWWLSKRIEVSWFTQGLWSCQPSSRLQISGHFTHKRNHLPLSLQCY